VTRSTPTPDVVAFLPMTVNSALFSSKAPSGAPSAPMLWIST